MRQCANWLDSYLDYVKGQESPGPFHEWTAMTVVSSALGRSVKINRGLYTIYPNLFVILVAGSGKCRKSVSTKIGIKLLNSLETPPMIFSQKITNEALIQALVESERDGNCCGLIYAPELSTFMGGDAHKSGLIPTMTDLYDSPSEWSYRTRGRGLEVMNNVSVAFLAASTKEWLRLSIPVDAIGGGFAARINFVFQDKPGKANLFPEVSEKAKKIRGALISDLNDIAKLKGSIMFTKEAKERATLWYEEEFLLNRVESVEGYYARKHDTMFKIATILCVCESNELLIEERHISLALEKMRTNEINLGHVMSSVQQAPVGGLMERILGIIKKSGGISHAKLLQQCWRFSTSEEISQYIKTLTESNEITVRQDDGTRYYE